MRIAYDAKRFFHNTSGLGNYSRDLVRMVAEKYKDVELLLIDKRPSERGSDIVSLPNVEVETLEKGTFSRQLKLGKQAEKNKVDIFHGLSGELPLRWGKKNIKKVVTIHDLIFLRYPEYYSFFDRKIHLWKFKKAAKAADKIIAISEQTRRDIVKYLGVGEEKVKVIYQGCHASFKEKISEDKAREVREKFKLPEHYLLSVGTIEKRKNLLSVVKAIKDLDIPLVVVGRKTPYFKKIESYIKKHTMHGRVHFLEGVSMQELSVLYKEANLFVYASFFEGFGIPVIEALFSGTAVITSNTSSMPEAGGEAAMYVDPKNVEDIRSKIKYLWENPEERKRRVALGYEHAEKFEDDGIASDLMWLYEGLL